MIKEDVFLEFWNNEAVKKGYKPLTKEEFRKAVTRNKFFDEELLYCLEENGSIQGMALCVASDDKEVPYQNERGYISFIIFKEEYETLENIKKALDYLEGKIKALGKKRLDFSFYNPMRLSWCMKGLDGHEHNNRPGVLMDSKLYRILTELGYKTISRECSMHMDITSYEMPKEMKIKEEELRKKGITIDYYSEKDLTGIEDFLKRLNNALWTIQIPESLKKGEPLIFVSDNGKAAGFTGPTIKEESGRGYFLGVAVDESIRGMGVGTLLFHKLCEGFKRAGVLYVTLFTGKENRALEIYKKVGFSVQEEFATMGKVL